MDRVARPLRTLLVANRGEIAVRIMRTARRMGLRCLAVYADADADALHVALADEAYRIGAAPPADSYLNAARILEAARAGGADAVHPGYGFLAENAAFAQACAEAGLVFIGPPPAAIRAMGSKSAAKALMEEAGVPLVPGYHGADQSPNRLAAEAARIGYPVLIKASSGGGGKGMKPALDPAGFADALASARREAAHAFGDDHVLIEKYLERPRHIEIQVFADRFGTTIDLFERDCSLQRRHQKIVEEAPAPAMDPALRRAMGQAAVAAARAVGYVGAGTVEFLVDGAQFFFMEMNTRLQVEHAVTEAITGLDLVEWQIRVARGEKLPAAREALAIGGHAIEARLYAEDPARGFLPQAGLLRHLVLPEGRPGIRVDAGVRPGDAVSVHYDPMIAKIIAHGADRAEALTRLAAAIDATEIVGLATNRDLLRAILRHPAFAAGQVDTGFIDRHSAALLPEPVPADAVTLALAALAAWLGERKNAPADPADPFSPWDQAGAWQPNLLPEGWVWLDEGETRHRITLRPQNGRYRLLLDGKAVEAEASLDAAGHLTVRLGGRRLSAHVVRGGGRLALFHDGRHSEFVLHDPRAPRGDPAAAAGRLVSPMPGTVVRVAVGPGDRVQQGALLVVVEAMKMEHMIRAPRDGVVGRVGYGVGDAVAEGAELLVLEAE